MSFPTSAPEPPAGMVAVTGDEFYEAVERHGALDPSPSRTGTWACQKNYGQRFGWTWSGYIERNGRIGFAKVYALDQKFTTKA